MKRAFTKTIQQAEVRARGLYGKRAWIYAPTGDVDKARRAAMVAWLDGLTLMVRSLDVPRKDVYSAISHMLARVELAGVFQVGCYDPTGFFKVVQGRGWDWDDAFAEAEAKEGLL